MPVNIHIGGMRPVFSLCGTRRRPTTADGDRRAERGRPSGSITVAGSGCAQGQLQREACAEAAGRVGYPQGTGSLPNPKWPVIGAVAGSVRTILEGAGGGVVAELALGWLAALTSS